MSAKVAIWKLVIALIIAAGLLAACGAPQGTDAPAEEQPTAAPTEAPAEEAPTAVPTEPPEDETEEQEAPTAVPTEAPQEEPPSEPPAALDGATLLEERCATCHGLDRTTSARKTREEWERTVVRMVSKGAELNDEEQEILITYLTETYGP